MSENEYNNLLNRIKVLLQKKERVIVAIDGRCGAGKSTLAEKFAAKLSGTVFHMDDFYLRPEQRTEERFKTPGGNVDYERFETEVLKRLSDYETITYCPFSCSVMKEGAPVTVKLSRLIIVEGSYSCHPKLWDYYDLRVFVTTDYETQLKRIEKRNGSDMLKNFINRWIPFEEEYFKAYNIEKRCDVRVKTTEQENVHDITCA